VSTISLRQFRSLQATTVRSLNWAGACDFSHEGTKWATDDDAGTYSGIYGRPFMDGRGLQYWGRILKWNDTDAAEIREWVSDCDLWFVKDDGITLVKLADPKAFGVEVEQSVGKTDKRLSRLFNLQPYWLWTGLDSVSIQEIEVGPASALALDGCEVTVSWDFARRVQGSSIAPFAIELERCTDPQRRLELEGHIHALKQMLHRDETGQCRVYFTAMTSKGQLKGHALIRNQEPDLIVLKGAYKKEVHLQDDSTFFCMFNPVHSSQLKVDVQTLTMHGTHGLFDGWLVEKVREYLNARLDEIEEGRWLERQIARAVRVQDQITLDEMLSWPLMQFVASGGDVRWFSHTLNQAARPIFENIGHELGKVSFPVEGYKRWYIGTDYRYGLSVPRGEYRLVGHSVIVNAVDYITADPSFEDIHALNAWIERGGNVETLEPGIAKTLGGCDQDDLVVVLDQFMSRSPTMVGEYWWFPHMGGPLQLDAAKLPPKPVVRYGSLPGNGINGRSKEDALKACQMLQKGAGAVGIAAKSLRYYVATCGKLPPELPATMEGIIDAAVQHFAPTQRVVDFFHRLNEWLARHSLREEEPIPVAFAEEFAASTLLDPERFCCGETWIDHILDEYVEVANAALDRLAGMRARAMPPHELLQFFVSAEEAAKRFRQWYGHNWQAELEALEDVPCHEEAERLDEVYERIRLASESFLDAFPKEARIDVLGATLGLVYKNGDGVEPVRDFVVFQRGAIYEMTLEAMRKAGVLGRPMVIDGELLLEVEDDPVPPRWSFPVYGAWAYSAGYEPAQVPSHLKKDLQQRDYAEGVIGAEVEVVETEVLVRGRPQLRVALWDTAAQSLLGTLPQGFLDKELPEVLHIVGAFVHDNALIVTCEAV